MKNKSIFKFLPILLLCLTPIIWFLGKEGYLINGVDTNFPLNPLVWFLRRLFVWNSISNGGSDFSSSVAGLFFHLIQVIPYQLGASLQMTQIINLVFWFSSIVTGSYLFARLILPKKYLIQVIFVALYAFNIYLFNTFENTKVANLSLVAALPFVLIIYLKLKNKLISIKKACLYTLVPAILVCGTGINPAYFIAFILTFFIFVLAELPLAFNQFFNRMKIVLLILTIIFSVNAFWIVPTNYFIFKNISFSGSLDKIGFSNWINSLSENTSLLNVIRGQGAWDWYAFDGITGLPIYIPYALKYFYSFPFLLFSFTLPLLAILSLIFKDSSNKHLYKAFGLMFLIGVFLGAGSHLPTGSIYNWLSRHLPFFTLFRSPWYIFTPMTILALAGLISFLFAYISNLLQSLSVLKRLSWTGLMILFLVANLVYSYPLLLGKIFRPERDDSFYVKFPDYIWEVKNWLGQDGKGRIIGYPDDEIEKFKWGYRGIESILNLFTTSEVLYSGLNAPDSKVSLMIKEFYLVLKKNQMTSALELATLLNIDRVFEKNDQESLSPSLSEIVKAYPHQTFEKWSFYELPTSPSKIFSAANYLVYYPGKENPSLGELSLGSSVLINSKDTVLDTFPKDLSNRGEVILASNLQTSDFINSAQIYSFTTHLTPRDSSSARFEIDVPKDGVYQPILERYRLEDFGIEIKKTLKFFIDDKEVDFEIQSVDDSNISFLPIKLTKGKHQIKLLIKSPNLTFFNEDPTKLVAEGEGEFKFIEEGEGKFLSIFNTRKKDTSALYPVSNFDPYSIYLVKLKYKQIYGNTALLVMGQQKGSVLLKSQAEGLPSYPDWIEANFYYQPVISDSKMIVRLAAPEIKDPLGTKVFYDDLQVYKVFTNKLKFVSRPETSLAFETNFKKISPVEYSGSAKGDRKPHFLVFLENFSPDWEISFFDKLGKKIDYKPAHFSADLYANGWFIQNMPEEYQFKIYYKPQRLFNIGLGISILSIFGILTSSVLIGVVKRYVK